MKKGKLFVLAGILVVLAGMSRAAIRLPRIYSDNMVIQRGRNIPVSGWAAPGERIVVVLGSYTGETVTGSDGKWKLVFDRLDEGGPYNLIVRGRDTITVRNVLIGEVWVCSGQSNMEMPVGNVAKWYSGVKNYQEEIKGAEFPNIRLFKEERIVSDKPQDDCKGSWRPCTPESVTDFSALAYFFGRDLFQNLGVPIGIIDASDGGTNISAWMSRETLEGNADFRPILDDFQRILKEYPAALKVYQQRMAAHQKEVERAKAEGKPIPWREPMPPEGPGDRNTPSGLYNGMIAPLMKSRVAGVIWYQGENNTGNPSLYGKLFPALIVSWRKYWMQGDFPFYYVQLAGFNTHQTWWSGSEKNWVLLREAQTRALSLPNTGMVVTADIGDANDTHFKNKQEAGRRLTLLALAHTYGKTCICTGPAYQSMEFRGNRILLHFDCGSSSLADDDTLPLHGFVIAGSDRKFYPATAKPEGNTVIVYSDKVEKPVAVRYSWNDFPDANLVNRARLPAIPFRTDDWPE